jgi:hypothetical protein
MQTNRGQSQDAPVNGVGISPGLHPLACLHTMAVQ